MIATSPEVSRRVSCLVRRESRACPVNSTNGIALAVLAGDGREKLAPAEHPLELDLPRVVVEQVDPRVRGVARHLLDAEVAAGEARDLREVRDREHLRPTGKARQRLAHRVRRLPADARVDLVEDERLAARDRGDRERQPRELSA
jgi:hypothetical protein